MLTATDRDMGKKDLWRVVAIQVRNAGCEESKQEGWWHRRSSTKMWEKYEKACKEG